MKGPYPFGTYDCEYVGVCRMMLILVPHLRLQYWYSYADVKRISEEPGFFRPLYKFALTLFPEEAINADPLCDMSELLDNVQHPGRRELQAPSSYPYYLPEVLPRSNGNGNGGSE